MTQIRSGGAAPAAVLAGSLAVFPLLDVLWLLARTEHVGELQVVADGVEARLWVDRGELLDHPVTAPDRLFELACLDDAWFTVSTTAPAHGEQRERVPLEPLLERVAPSVAEWHSLMKALPFGAVARMSPVMPGPEAQIRSDQWRILSLIGTGRPVHEVVDVSEDRPLETLRLIHELAQKELIVVELPPAGARRVRPVGSTLDPSSPQPTRAEPVPAEPVPAEPPAAAGAAPSTPVEAVPLGEAADAGSAGEGAPDEEVGRDDALPTRGRVVAARATTTPLTAKRPGSVRTVVPDPMSRPRGNGHHAVAAYMPPPVTPTFWPLLDPDAERSS